MARYASLFNRSRQLGDGGGRCGCSGGCGGSCRCCAQRPTQGLAGNADIERFLVRYAYDKIRRSEPFYLSPRINSDVMTRATDDPGLGQFQYIPMIFSAVKGIMMQSAQSGLKQPTQTDMEALVQNDLTTMGVTSTAPQTALSPANIQTLAIVGGGLLLVLLLKR